LVFVTSTLNIAQPPTHIRQVRFPGTCLAAQLAWVAPNAIPATFTLQNSKGLNGPGSFLPSNARFDARTAGKDSGISSGRREKLAEARGPYLFIVL
jgi:hypothetical protein